MATTAERSTPAHLWIVGILALLWNGYGCYEYVMTMTADPGYMAQVSAEQLAYWETLPSWLTAFWALGVWGGLVGAVLLLIRSRYAVWAMALSFIGAVIGIGYQLFVVRPPASLTEGMMGVLPWVIIIVAALLLWYSWSMDKKGVLR